MNIPVIDLTGYTQATKQLSPSPGTVSSVLDAASEWGFFYLTGHGLKPALVDRVWRQTRTFFDLPRADKCAVMRTKANPRGYYDRELTKNKRDCKEVFDFGRNTVTTIDGKNQWPVKFPDFGDTMYEWLEGCERIAFDLLNILCVGLGIDGRTLGIHFAGAHTSFARLNHYPLGDPFRPMDSVEATALGDQALHEHTDAGALTILLQDEVGGLQVKAGNTWHDIVPIPDSLVVNIGDMMQVWSNDQFIAATHRVRPVTTRSRYSIPFFFNPTYDTNYAPLPTLTALPARYHSINWGEFRQTRADGDYEDYGKEIQISDFRVRS